MPILPLLMLDSGQIIPTEDLRYAACEMDEALATEQHPHLAIGDD